MEREHQNESHLLQVGQAVARIKESLDINRNENRNWRDQVKRDAAEIQEELRREADDMRNSLMAEIRKMSRPMIVM